MSLQGGCSQRVLACQNRGQTVTPREWAIARGMKELALFRRGQCTVSKEMRDLTPTPLATLRDHIRDCRSQVILGTLHACTLWGHRLETLSRSCDKHFTPFG
jgi:hypothetical protein